MESNQLNNQSNKITKIIVFDCYLIVTFIFKSFLKLLLVSIIEILILVVLKFVALHQLFIYHFKN
jgi:hypothetical protein